MGTDPVIGVTLPARMPRAIQQRGGVLVAGSEEHAAVVRRRMRPLQVIVEILRNGQSASACRPGEPAGKAASATVGPKLPRQGAEAFPGLRLIALIHTMPALPPGVTCPLRLRHSAAPQCRTPKLVVRPRAVCATRSGPY